MTTATRIPDRPTIEYPDSDGSPMADNTLQYEWIVTIKGGLDAIFIADPNIFVAGDLLWYAVKGEPGIRKAPDVMVAFGRPKGYRGSYKQWEEGNVAPQAVFEILSPGHGPVEMDLKFQFYQQYAVEEYYVYDPDNGPLEGWLRVGDRLRKVPQMAGFVSPRLRIRFDPGEGPDNLRIFGPDGTPFRTFTEWVEKSKADQRRADSAEDRVREQAKLVLTERQRVDEERQRADEERQRANAADERAASLAARLRELGIDPE
jgi:Uma2 family endonuclease